MYLPVKQLSILAGASGSGKTTLVAQALHARQLGTYFPLQIHGQSVAYVAADRNMEEVQGKLNKAGVANYELYSIVDDPAFHLSYIDNPDVMLEKVLAQFKRPYDLLVVDPMGLFVINVNDFREVAKACMRFNRLAAARDITILATHHASKSRTDFTFVRPQDRILGSGAFQGYSGTQMVLIEDYEKGTQFHRFYMVSHTEAQQDWHLLRDSEGWFQVVDQPTLDVQLFSQLPLTFSMKDLIGAAKEVDMSRATLYRRLGEWMNEGVLKKDGHGRYMKLHVPTIQ